MVKRATEAEILKSIAVPTGTGVRSSAMLTPQFTKPKVPMQTLVTGAMPVSNPIRLPTVEVPNLVAPKDPSMVGPLVIGGGLLALLLLL